MTYAGKIFKEEKVRNDDNKSDFNDKTNFPTKLFLTGEQCAKIYDMGPIETICSGIFSFRGKDVLEDPIKFT